MPKNTKPRTDEQGNLGEQLLDLLTRICITKEQTFSWYTSSKGRAWLQLKGKSPIPYTTAVECKLDASLQSTYDALTVLISAHFPKVLEEEPPLVSWLNTKAIGEQLERGRAYCAALYLGVLDVAEDEEFEQGLPRLSLVEGTSAQFTQDNPEANG